MGAAARHGRADRRSRARLLRRLPVRARRRPLEPHRSRRSRSCLTARRCCARKLAAALPQKEDVPVALRIVDALAVHRLTTEDIDVPIGLTVDELRDDLCLHPRRRAGARRRASSARRSSPSWRRSSRRSRGQFLSRNDDNGQIFLDVRKDIDYDQLIEERADSLDDQRARRRLLPRARGGTGAARRALRRELPHLVVRASVDGKERDAPGLPVHGRAERALHRAAPAGLLHLLPSAIRRAGVRRRGTAPTRLSSASPVPDEEFTAALRRYAGATR